MNRPETMGIATATVRPRARWAIVWSVPSARVVSDDMQMIRWWGGRECKDSREREKSEEWSVWVTVTESVTLWLRVWVSVSVTDSVSNTHWVSQPYRHCQCQWHSQSHTLCQCQYLYLLCCVVYIVIITVLVLYILHTHWEWLADCDCDTNTNTLVSIMSMIGSESDILSTQSNMQLILLCRFYIYYNDSVIFIIIMTIILLSYISLILLTHSHIISISHITT